MGSPLFSFRPLQAADGTNLLEYLEALSPQTRNRFGPHAYTHEAIQHFYHPYEPHLAFVASPMHEQKIVAYFIIRKGVLMHDMPRLQSYGLTLNHQTDFTFAPSVADAYQGTGLGTPLLQYVLREIKAMGAKRLILWGGVQSNNHQAIRFYNKNGFEILGQFEYQGWNTDMILHL
jgi:diamine N-acetyltransferase